MERRVRRMKTVAKEMREIIVRQLGGKMDKDEQLAQRSTDVLDTMLLRYYGFSVTLGFLDTFSEV